MIYSLNCPLILASGSPRRKELLKEAGFNFDIYSSDLDETVGPGEEPKNLVIRLAMAKANVVAQKFPQHFVLGADTDVALGQRIFGKPANKQDAVSMLSKLSGSTHQVLGGIALVNLEKGISLTALSETAVSFRTLSISEMEAYADTNEPYDKAGSYAAQGIGASFISSITGSYSNVVGLDIAVTVELFAKAGILQVLSAD